MTKGVALRKVVGLSALLMLCAAFFMQAAVAGEAVGGRGGMQIMNDASCHM